MQSKVKIVMTGHGRGSVFINGQEVPRVMAIEFQGGAKRANQVTVTFVPEEVEIDSEETDIHRYARITSGEN